MRRCSFCKRAFAKQVGLSIHLLSCRRNPNRDNNYIERHREASRGRTQRWSAKQRKQHSARMQQAVRDHPQSYLGRWRRYSVEYKGEVYDSKWEVLARKYFDKHYITATRKVKARFKYWFDDKYRTYVPDFYLKELGVYVEVKGVITHKDVEKWKQFPKNKRLLVLTRVSIRRVINGAKLGLVAKIRSTDNSVLVDGAPFSASTLNLTDLRIATRLPKLSTEERSKITKRALAKSDKMAARRRLAKVRRRERWLTLNKNQRGKRNSQYGTHWITDGVSNKKWNPQKGKIPKTYRLGRI